MDGVSRTRHPVGYVWADPEDEPDNQGGPMSDEDDSERVIIVGAGIAGLVCAIELERAGRRVLLLERESTVGGRVRTERRDGFVLDRGFQVLFTAYPVLGSYLEEAALNLRPFVPAARIALPTGTSIIGDAIRDPSVLAETILSAQVGIGDIWRLLKLRRQAVKLSVDAIFSSPFANTGTLDFLKQRGFSRDAIERFFVPFYGGILLDRELATSAAVLLFTFKMFAEAPTALPAAGMVAIPEQLRSRLKVAEVRTGTEVTSILVEGNRAAGVKSADGDLFRARDVVLAAESPVSAALGARAGVTLGVPQGALGCATVYLASRDNLLPGQAVNLNGAQGAIISHAVTVSDVAPEYAPAGEHLIAMTAVGDAATRDDAALVRHAIAELAMMRRASIPSPPRALAIVRVPYSQFVHPPGYFERRPGPATSLPGLWLSGEALHSSSLEGAAIGGRTTARAISTAAPGGG
jgi:phytoene dehydrogenase-like protein